MEAFGEKVFETVVKRSVKLPDASVAAEPITSYAVKHDDAKAYRQLTRELIRSQPVPMTLLAQEDSEVSSGFTVDLDGFDGTFDLLLGLIAKRQMDVTTVALGEVTDQLVSTSAPWRPSAHWRSPPTARVRRSHTAGYDELIQLLPGAEAKSEEDMAKP